MHTYLEVVLSTDRAGHDAHLRPDFGAHQAIPAQQEADKRVGVGEGSTLIRWIRVCAWEREAQQPDSNSISRCPKVDEGVAQEPGSGIRRHRTGGAGAASSDGMSTNEATQTQCIRPVDTTHE